MSTPTQFDRGPWKDCMDIYPPAAEIASALQDPGKKVPGRHKGKPIVKHKFPLIEKLATKLYNEILHHFGNHGVVTKNNTRGKQPLFKEILIARRHTDVAMTDPFFPSLPRRWKSVHYFKRHSYLGS